MPGRPGRPSRWSSSTSASDARRPTPRSTTRGWRRSRCSRRCGSRTPTPTWCCRGAPQARARHPRRGVRDRAGVGHDPPAGDLRRDPRRLHRPAAAPGRGEGPRRAAPRLPPAAGMRVPAHAAISSTVDLVHAEVGAGAAGFVNAVLRKVAEHDLEAWIAEVAPDPADLAEPVRRDRLQPPALGGRRAARAPSAPTSSTRCSRPTTSRPRSPWWRGPGAVDRRRAARHADAVLAVRRGARRRRPGRVPAVAEGRAGVQDEGSQLVALALADAPVDGQRRAVGRPVRRPGWQGRAARRAGGRARRGRAGDRGSTHRPDWCAGRSAGADGVARRGRRRRHPAAAGAPARPTGCWSTPRAPAWVRCGAGPRRAGAGGPTTC